MTLTESENKYTLQSNWSTTELTKERKFCKIHEQLFLSIDTFRTSILYLDMFSISSKLFNL